MGSKRKEPDRDDVVRGDAAMILGTHAQRLERWLGADTVEGLSRSMKNWHGPPIAVAGVPGGVFAHKGGDFRGPIRSGQFLSAAEFGVMRMRRVLRNVSRQHWSRANAGFASYADLLAEMKSGKTNTFPFSKTSSNGTVNGASSIWRLGVLPPAGVAPGAAPGGTATDDTTTGAFPFTNPASGDTQHFVSASVRQDVATSSWSLLLYDRLFHVLKTMNSTSTEAVTGVPTRYQSTTSTDMDYVGGNFLFVEVGGTQLAATAHNWTVCTYKDQDNVDSTLSSLAGNSAAVIDRLDHPSGQWFAPLEAGDVGVKALTQMQCDAAVATGVINFVIGHPIAFIPCALANVACVTDGILTAFNLVRIFDDACLAFLEVMTPATSNPTWYGSFTTVSG